MSGSCIELALRVCLLLWTVALGGCTAYFAARRG